MLGQLLAASPGNGPAPPGPPANTHGTACPLCRGAGRRLFGALGERRLVRCATCRLAFLDRAPPGEKVERHYRGYRGSRLLRRVPALARLLAQGYYFNPLVWDAASLRLLLDRAGFVDVRLWNSQPSAGDPYRRGGRAREAAVDTVKRALHLAARGVDAVSRGRLLVGSSLAALAARPAAASRPMRAPGPRSFRPRTI